MNIKENLNRTDSGKLLYINGFVSDWVKLNQAYLESENMSDADKVTFMHFRMRVLKEELKLK